jgi:hypothetical protein
MGEAIMNESNGSTRLAYILGVPLAEDAQRQWPQMGEVVRGRDLIASVEGNFPELTLEVGRRLHLDDTIVVEWTCNYGGGCLYRNVSIAELRNGEAHRVTDYWGEPVTTPHLARRDDSPTRHARRRHLEGQRPPAAPLTFRPGGTVDPGRRRNLS